MLLTQFISIIKRYLWVNKTLKLKWKQLTLSDSSTSQNTSLNVCYAFNTRLDLYHSYCVLKINILDKYFYI